MRRRPALPTRGTALARLRARLLREGFPRLQMLLLVALTSGAGFLASVLLLRAGYDSLGTRYALAMLVAYLAFLGLLGLWLYTRARDYADLQDPGWPGGSSPRGDTPPHTDGYGGGGESAGGGASSSFDAPVDTPGGDSATEDAIGSVADAADSVGAADALGSADEAAVPIVVIGLVLAVALSSLWVVYAAPMLFAELMLDAALGTALYRRLRHEPARHWLETAVRRTAWPFALTFAVVVTLGAVAQSFYPDARTAGDVLVAIRGSQAFSAP